MPLLLLKSPECYPELQLIPLEYSEHYIFLSGICIAFILTKMICKARYF